MHIELQRRITNDVLNLSKLSSGNMYLCLEPVRPTQLIASVCDMFSAQARSNNIDFTVHLPEAPLGHLCVHADPYRLSQVIVNLVSNALKFTLNCVERKVSVRLWILKPEVAEGASDRVVVNMSVKDTGVGMNEDEQASLFQRFRQANLKTYSRYGGTGLGLYISKMVLDLMGGEIHVQSAPQQGSTFSLAFPCTIADSALESRDAEVVAATSVHYLRSLAHSPKLLTLQPTVQPEDINSPITPISSARPSPEPASASELVSPISASSSSAAAAAAAVRSRKRPLNILVVEDNDVNQRILKRQLESSNAFKCQATVAENGLVAVNLVESQKFDLVLMDVEMPVMDGLEATKRIRLCEEQTQRHRIPIIGLSGNARDVTGFSFFFNILYLFFFTTRSSTLQRASKQAWTGTFPSRTSRRICSRLSFKRLFPSSDQNVCVCLSLSLSIPPALLKGQYDHNHSQQPPSPLCLDMRFFYRIVPSFPSVPLIELTVCGVLTCSAKTRLSTGRRRDRAGPSCLPGW